MIYYLGQNIRDFFSRFRTVSLYEKSNWARLFIISRKWLCDSKKILEMLEIKGECPAGHPKLKLW